MNFYHGTNKFGLAETEKQGFLLHKRVVLDKDGNLSKMYKPDPCVYLTDDLKIAKQYGEIIIEVDYDPFKNPRMNNYCDNCWQFRVYEPIKNWKVK